MKDESFGETKKWDATCSACGAATKVPFEPDPERDVFCGECYKKQPRKKSPRHH